MTPDPRLQAVADAIQAEEDKIAEEREALSPPVSLARKLIAGHDALAAYDSQEQA